MDSDNTCLIGTETRISGRLTGDQSISIEGVVEGEISLANELSILEAGEVAADIEADVVVVEGEVDGDIVARDLVTLAAGCRVTGDITTPRIELEEEAEFKGGIDMDVPGAEAAE